MVEADFNWWAEIGRFIVFLLSIAGVNKIMISPIQKRVEGLESRPIGKTEAECRTLRENCPVALSLIHDREMQEERRKNNRERYISLDKTLQAVLAMQKEICEEMKKEFKDHRQLHLEIAEKIGKLEKGM